MKTLLVKRPFVQWQPDGSTIHTNKWFPGAGFLGAGFLGAGFLGAPIQLLVTQPFQTHNTASVFKGTTTSLV